MTIVCPGVCTVCPSSPATAASDSFSFSANCPAGSQSMTFTMDSNVKVSMSQPVTFCSLAVSTTVVRSIQAPSGSAYSISATDSCSVGSYTAVVSCHTDCACPATASATSDAFSFNANCPEGSYSVTVSIQGNTQITKAKSILFCSITIPTSLVGSI